MQRRIIAGVLAAVLTIVGAILLVNYVRNADARAMAGQQPTKVLIVAKQVPAGTAAADLAAYVQQRDLPKNAVVKGSVSDLSQLAPEKVANIALEVGEQVLAARFVPVQQAELDSDVKIPVGLSLISIELEPQRVLGARLKAGDTVGVIVSTKVKKPPSEDEIPITHVLADKVLVARVQGAAATEQGSGASAAPAKDVIVTLAVDSQLAEKIAWAQEFAKIWLSAQGTNSVTGGTKVVDVGVILPS